MGKGERALNMVIGAHLRRWVFVIALLLPWIGAQLAEPFGAEGASSGWGSNGNCNNWVPHGWSWTQWSGQPSGSSGGLSGSLDWYDGFGWVSQQGNEAAANGASGDPMVDNYLGTNEQGTGSWQESAGHSATFWQTSQSSQHSIWCGY